MVLRDIIIKLVRYGGKHNPSYSITLTGDGTATFIGFKNVRIKGKIKTNIDENDFLDILSRFKEIDFFSIKEEFFVDKNSEREYTNISITLPLGDNNLKTTEIRHYNYDKNVSHDLIKLEKLIEKKINVDKWVQKPKIEKKEKIKLKKIFPKFNKKIVVLPIVFILLSTLFFGYNIINSNESDTNNEPNDSDQYNYDPIKLSYFVTTKDKQRRDLIRTESYEIFNQGDTVYLDLEYRGILHDNKINITTGIVVSNEDDIYYKNSYDYIKQDANSSIYYLIYNFTTNNSWPNEKTYTVTAKIIDHISEKTCNYDTTFILKNSSFVLQNPLDAKIVNLTLVDDYKIYFEGSASGGTGYYTYTWNFYDYFEGILIGSTISKSGYYKFDDYTLVNGELIVNDGKSSDIKYELVLVKTVDK